MNLTFAPKRRVQSQSEEAKRTHLSTDFLYSLGPREYRKSGDKSDRKMVLQSE
ncbi:hypothetical protein ABGV43_09370 [Paenibacillus amylolyticus]